MKDFLGKELNVGDEVVFIAYDRDLKHGIVTRITEKTATILTDNKKEFRRELSKVFKVESKQAILDKIYLWLDENAFEYVKTVTFGINDIYKGFDSEKMIADLKKTMEE
jgi:hypothetical protein